MNETMNKRWREYFFLATALDPIHVGAGGYRLGRVDLTICREPVSGIPKIPGTTMSGAIKFFADMALIDAGVKKEWCASTKGSDHDETHKSTCPICYAFGYTPKTGSQGQSRQGILDFGDALLLLFPVRTMLGPVWVTSPGQLERLLGSGTVRPPEDEKKQGETEHSEFKVVADKFALPSDSSLKTEVGRLRPSNHLNIGWLYLEKATKDASFTARNLTDAGVEPVIADRTMLLPERLFEHVVNDQLEVRTSVAIDPTTGAADEGALFTYETVPRGAIFLTCIVVNDYSKGWKDIGKATTLNGRNLTEPISLVEKAFNGLAAVGLGGMTTRGFGRLKLSPAKENAGLTSAAPGQEAGT